LAVKEKQEISMTKERFAKRIKAIFETEPDDDILAENYYQLIKERLLDDLKDFLSRPVMWD
jgi:hypothetical protein